MNNLFKDYKHNKDFLSLIHYKLGYKLYNIISNNNHPNLLIHGVNGSGKTLLIKTVLNDLFNINKYTKKELLTENINYERSDFHYYFDLKLINNDLKFIDFIKDIVKSYNHYTNKYNYIILDNFEYLSNLNQDRLRVIFEKSLNTSKIIIITSKLNKINNPLLSRFINIRIPLHNLTDKYIYFKELLNKNYYVISDDILYNILKKHSDLNYNFINILSYLKNNIINGDIYDEINLKYMNIINSKKDLTKKITDMKQLIYLSRSLIDINTFYRRFITYLLDLNISNDKKSELVRVFTENNILVDNSFKDLLYLEGLLVEIYWILTSSS
jgi:DNA polymerase III delta prime subunit